MAYGSIEMELWMAGPMSYRPSAARSCELT